MSREVAKRSDTIFITEIEQQGVGLCALAEFTPEEILALQAIKPDSRCDEEANSALIRLQACSLEYNDYQRTVFTFSSKQIQLLKDFLEKKGFLTLGKKLPSYKSTVITSQALCDTSVRVNRSGNAGALFLLIQLCSRDDIIYDPKKRALPLQFAQWQHILEFIFHPESFFQTARYATAIRRPSLFPQINNRWQDPSFVVDAVMRGQENVVVNMLRADPSCLLQKAKVKNSVGAELELTPLQAAIATGDVAPNTKSTGLVEIILEHLKKLKPDTYQDIFEEQAREIYEESLLVYRRMQKKEIARLCKLGGELSDSDRQRDEINQKIKDARANRDAYVEALDSHDLEKLFKTHEKAQADNAFDFEPYVKAILDIDPNDPQLADVMALIDADELAFFEFSDNEIRAFKEAANSIQPRSEDEREFFDKINTMVSSGSTKFEPCEVQWLIHLAEKTGQQDLSNSLQEKMKIKTAAAIASTNVGPRESEECRNKPFDQLTLVQKLNRFREKYVEHKKQEMIDNPNHILQALKHNEDAWEKTLSHNQDPNYHKRMVIFSQLAGWAQRNAAESMRQDIRQGTRHLTEKTEQRTRQAGFNEVDSSCLLGNIRRSSLVDVSLFDSSVTDGCGYKFACIGYYFAYLWAVDPDSNSLAPFFSTYVEQKQQTWRNLYDSLRTQARVCCCCA